MGIIEKICQARGRGFGAVAAKGDMGCEAA